MMQSSEKIVSMVYSQLCHTHICTYASIDLLIHVDTHTFAIGGK